MLTTKLEQLWEKTSAETRIQAITEARVILGNLVHYPTQPKNYYTDDVERLAAELLAFRDTPIPVSLRDTKLTIHTKFLVERQLLMDLLCTAVEGGSNYWAKFSDAQRTIKFDYLSVLVEELEPGGTQPEELHRVVTAEDLMIGLRRMAEASTEPSLRHLHDALSENGDAITADVVLQWTVFGEVVYG